MLLVHVKLAVVSEVDDLLIESIINVRNEHFGGM